MSALRYDSRQEPYAVVPHVRICAGGGEKSPSLPRPLDVLDVATWRRGDVATVVFSLDPAPREARDAGMEKSMDDLAIQRTPKAMPFDGTRMRHAALATIAQA